jgi:hypothetical protein
VWTTRVSNPVRSPHFRASASIAVLWDAFAIGVLCNIYAFHRYTTHSSHSIRIPDEQFQRQFTGWARTFHRWLILPPTHPLNPINPDNACILRITAAAGTELADAYSYGTLISLRVDLIAPIQKKLKIHRTLSFTRHGWIRFPSIVQYSSLLPPVGVWTVSQFQCGGPSSQNP